MIKHLLFVVVLLCITTTISYSQICTGPLTVNVEGSTDGNPLNVTGVETQPVCNELSGTLTGAVDLTAAGGSPAYFYDWDHIPTPDPNISDIEDLTGLGAGTYSVTVTDSKGCTGTAQFVIVEPTPVEVVGVPTDLDCNSGSGAPSGGIDITPSGGQGTVEGDYTYTWSTADGTGLVASQADQLNLSAGTYDVTVTDANGCTATGSWTLTEPTPVAVTGTTVDLSCNAANGPADGQIDITPSGGQGLDETDFTYAWTTVDGSGLTATGADQTDLSAGTYTVVVTDANGCTATETFTLVEPPIISILASATDLACNDASGSADGAIDITVSGGTGGYTYTWETTDGSGLVAGADDQTGLTAGTYSLTVTDDNGCMQLDSYTLTQPNPVTIVGTTTDLDCNDASGVANGAIDITAGGGQGTVEGDYTYAWTTIDGSGLIAGDADQTGLSAGSYTVVVTDANGCTAQEIFDLTEPDPVVVAGAQTDLDCNSGSGAPSGGIDITASGGQGLVEGDYTYSWNSPDGSGLVASAADQSGLSAGTYNVTVTDANGCTGEGSWTLTEPTAVNVVAATTDLSCNEANGPIDGIIDVIPSGGQGSTDADYTFAWTTTDGFGLSETAGDQSGLAAGTYTVVVTDSNGCTATGSWTLTEPPIISILASATDLECNNASGPATGAIDITVSGGQGSAEGDYTYNWVASGGGSGIVATAADQTGLTAGTYSVTVTDANGCIQADSYTLSEPNPVVVSGVVTELLCNAASGDPTGEIDITASGGQGLAEGDYTYAWTTTDGTGLIAGDADQTGLSAGTYVVVVTDSNGCTTTETWTLGEPDAVECDLDSPVVGVGGTNILCAGETGTINVTPTGGVAPYTYSLDGGLTTQTESTFTVTAGTYTVTVYDANGCESTCDIELTEPPALIAGTCVVEDECQLNQGEIEVAAEGGVGPYTVTWTSPTGGTLNETTQEITTSGGSVTFTGAQGGETYIFTVTDANGCDL